MSPKVRDVHVIFYLLRGNCLIEEGRRWTKATKGCSNSLLMRYPIADPSTGEDSAPSGLCYRFKESNQCLTQNVFRIFN
jgi:hypothetical protein